MKFPAWLRSRIHSGFHAVSAKIFHRAATEHDIEEELRSHLQHRADDLMRSGLTAAEAERRARIDLGGYEKFRARGYEAVGGNTLETFAQDARFSVRVLLRSPGFLLTAVATLALAIGANSVVFGILNEIFLRPHVPQARSLYALQRGNETYIQQSYPDYRDLRDRNHSFEALVAYNIGDAALDMGDAPSRSYFYSVSGNYFDALGIQPYLGRVLHGSDEQGPNSAPYIVLGYGFWHSRFHDDTGVVGRVVQLNKHPFTIVGVAPPQFHGTLVFFTPDFYMPIVDQEQTDGVSWLDKRGSRGVFEILGHLRPGVTPSQAAADLSSIGAALHKAFPKEDDQTDFSLVNPGLHGNFFAPALRAFLIGLMLLAGLILLAACANLGSLFAARAADRSREMALRIALGSSRSRILRQLFTEAVLVSLLGGAAGLAGAVVVLHRLSSWQPFPQFPISIAVNPDVTVYSVSLLLSLAAGFLFGAVPVRQVLRTNPYQVVKAGATGQPGRRLTARDILLVAQIAICALLVMASMVAVRGLHRSLHTRLGIDPDNAMLAETDLAMAGYRDEQVVTMQKRMVEAVQKIPGVDSAGLVSDPPLHMGWAITDIFSDKTIDFIPANALGRSIRFSVSPEYLAAAQTTLLAGRNITAHDDKDAPLVALVNQEFVRKFFGSGKAAMGSTFRKSGGVRVQIVGIVEDGKYTANIAERPQPAMFQPMLQAPVSDSWLVIRSRRGPQQVATAVRNALHELDSGLPVFVQTWSEEMNGALFATRIATASLGILGVMGAMLSITGIFGMAAYSVSRRLRELGIRIALGAQRSEVLKAALRRPLQLLAIGSVAGLVLGVLATRVLASIVYQATPRDPFILAGVVFAMALLGLVATWLPALRALSADPLRLLREE